MLGQLGEAPGIRDLVSSSVVVPPSIAGNWVTELSADAFAVRIVGSAAGSLPGQRDVALAGCILALQHAAMLERVVTMASPVPWPPDSGQPPDFSTMPTHPPADLRLHVACAVASQGATELAQPYQAAIVALLDGISEASGGQCIAPRPEPDRWCGRARAAADWFCAAHSAHIAD